MYRYRREVQGINPRGCRPLAVTELFKALAAYSLCFDCPRASLRDNRLCVGD
jgi:hypothetical protein